MQEKSQLPIGQTPDIVPLSKALDAARTGRAFSSCDGNVLAELTGADRHRFLNGLVTCDVGNLEPGGSVYGFCTSIQGRILSDLWVTSLGESLLLEIPSARADFLEEHLSKYRIADRVEISRRADWAALVVFRPNGQLAGGSDRTRDEGAVRVESEAGVAISLPRALAGIEAEVLWAPRSELGGWVEPLVASDMTQIGAEAWNCLHVEAGHLRYGLDFDERNFPQETGLDALAVSYTKGCYLGQEVVARIHYRGGVKRFPRGLRFSSEPSQGEELRLEDREVGRIGASAVSPTFGPIGLAIVHSRGADPGTVLQTPTRAGAVVVGLPFAAPS